MDTDGDSEDLLVPSSTRSCAHVVHGGHDLQIADICASKPSLDGDVCDQNKIGTAEQFPKAAALFTTDTRATKITSNGSCSQNYSFLVQLPSLLTQIASVVKYT